MASSVIGALRVNLGLDSAEFRNGLKRSSSSLAKFGKAATRGFAVAAAATGAAMTQMARRSFNVVDEQAKMAQSLGTSVASMQVLQRASELAGISQGELEQVSLQLTKRLSQVAATGKGPAAAALKRLGLNAQDLADMDLDQKIAVINRAIADTVPAAEQAAVAAALFGDRAGLLAGRLDAATISTAADELRRFGVIVSDVDADKIEEANDAMSSLGLVTKGLGNQLAVSIAPVVKRIAQALADMGARFTALSPKTKTLVASLVGMSAVLAPVIMGAGLLAAGLAALASPLGLVIMGAAALAAGAAYVVTQWDELNARFPVLGEAARRLGDAWRVLSEAAKAQFANIRQTVSDFISGFKALFSGDFRGAIDGFGNAFGGLGEIVSTHFRAVLDVIAALFPEFTAKAVGIVGAIRDGLAGLRTMALDQMRAFGARVVAGIAEAAAAVVEAARQMGRDIIDGLKEGIAAKWSEIKAYITSLAMELPEWIRGPLGIKSPSRVFMGIGRDLMDGLQIGIDRNAVKARDATGRAVTSINETMKGLTHSPAMQGLQSAFGSISDGIADVVFEGKKMGKTLGAVFKQLGRQLLTSGLNALFTGELGGSKLGGGGGGLLGGFKGFFANGGTLGAGEWGIAGEAGPEPVVGPARIISNTDAFGGGRAVNLTFAPVIDARGADAAAVARIEAGQRAMAQNFDQMVGQALTNGRMRRAPGFEGV